MMKVFKIILIISFGLVFAFIVYYQYKAEAYLINVKNKYGIFENIDRKSYKPFVLFYIQAKRNPRKYDIYWQSVDYPFRKNGLIEGYIINFEYTAYYMYCFYELGQIPQNYMGNPRQTP